MIRKSTGVAVQAVGTAIPQLVGCLPQEEELWCWAACIQMALQRLPLTNKNQCAVVKTAFPKFAEDNIDCCTDPAACDRGCDPSLVVDKFFLNETTADLVEGQLTLSELREEINVNRRLVCVHWKGGSTNGIVTPDHMVLVVGISATTDDLIVCDPNKNFLRSPMKFAELQAPSSRNLTWHSSWKI